MEIDLPMLRQFEALMTHESVTDAAAAVGMTQPGMSIALGKMRKAFGDTVLVRTGGRMVATDHARALLPEVRQILQRTRALGSMQARFDAASTTARFSIALMESVAALLLPGLVRRLAHDAPDARLTCRASNHERIQEWFDNGDIHLGIGYHPRLPGHLHTKVLFEDSWALVLATTHPFNRHRPDMARLLQTPLIKVSPAASDIYWDLIVAAIAAAGGKPILGPSVPSFLVAAHIAAESDLVTLMPMRLARSLAAHLPVRAQPLPLALPPLAFGMRWHPRTHTAAEHRWFRGVAFECSRAAMVTSRERKPA